MIKNFKKLISCFLVFSIFAIQMEAAAEFVTPGQTEYTLNAITLGGGQSAEIGFYLPFDSEGIVISYSAIQDTEITIETGQQACVIALPSNSTEAVFSFTQAERKGERQYILAADSDITLDITFAKYTYSDSGFSVNGNGNIPLPALSDNETAVSSAVIIDRNASAIVVRGAHRYIDNDNADKLPEIIDGSIYLPARVLALALGCYYENIPTKNFVFLRESDSGKEFYFRKNDCYTMTNLDEKLPLTFKPVYKNGEPYLPVRFLAEALGKTVGYKDGLVVIDDTYSVSNILNTDTVFAYAKGLLAEFVPAYAEKNIYHVAQSADANDENNGTASKPFKTLAKACEVAKAGDTVIIHEGTYREILAPKNDGTAANPIIFRGADGEKVVISATEAVSGFTSSAENAAWAEAMVSWDLGEGRNQVFWSGECMIEARYPNSPEIGMSANGEALSDLFPVRGDFRVDATDKTIVTSDTLLKQDTPNYWKDAAFISMHGYGWTLSTAKISASEYGKLTLDEESFAAKWWYDRADHDSLWNYGYISGHKNAIDLSGEWVMENGKLIMMPPENVDLSDLTVEVKARQLTMDLAERKYIQIIGLESFGGGVTMKDSEMCILNDVDMKYISHYTFSDDQREGYIDDGSNRAKRYDGETGAPARGEVGVYVGGRNNAVINSVIDHSAASGLYLGGLYAYIDNNVIKNCGYMGSYVSGITACSEPWGEVTEPRGGFGIYNNTVYNAGRSLINVLGTEFINDGNIVEYQWKTSDGKLTYNIPYVPYEVAYNDLHDGMLTSMDTGLFYSYMVTCATDKVNSRVHNNYVYSTVPETNPWSNGIYSDGGSIGVDYYNNVVFTTEEDTGFSYSHIAVSKNSTTSTKSANSEIKNPVAGGASSLTAEQFPLAKPFYAGTLTDAAYMKNYEKSSDTVRFYSVKDAVLTGTSVDSSGGAVIDESTDSICFTNVDFGEDGSNRINIYFTADKYKNMDVLTVYAGDSPDTAQRCETLVHGKSDTLQKVDFVSADIGKIQGVTNVYISIRDKFLGLKPSILGIMLSNDAKPQRGHDGTSVTAADFDRIHQIGTLSQAVRNATTGNGQYVMNTVNGTVLVYEAVTFSEAMEKFTMTFRGYSNNPTISFHLNSPDADAFFSCGSQYTESKVETVTYDLASAVSPGTYDIYVKFTIGGTMDLFSFGFLPA